MSSPIREILVVLDADYVPQKISAEYKLAHQATIQAINTNDINGSAIGSENVDPRTGVNQKGIILFPAQAKSYDMADLSETYLAGKAGDRFLVQYQLNK